MGGAGAAGAVGGAIGALIIPPPIARKLDRLGGAPSFDAVDGRACDINGGASPNSATDGSALPPLLLTLAECACEPLLETDDVVARASAPYPCGRLSVLVCRVTVCGTKSMLPEMPTCSR